MKAPATAKEYTSTPKMLRMDSPPNKKRSISTKETNVINSGWIFPVLCVENNRYAANNVNNSEQYHEARANFYPIHAAKLHRNSR